VLSINDAEQDQTKLTKPSMMSQPKVRGQGQLVKAGAKTNITEAL